MCLTCCVLRHPCFHGQVRNQFLHMVPLPVDLAGIGPRPKGENAMTPAMLDVLGGIAPQFKTVFKPNPSSP